MTPRRHPRSKRLARALLFLATTALVALALAFGARSSRGQAASTPRMLASAASSGAAPVTKRSREAPNEAAQKVLVGAYVHHVNQVDLRSNTFLADFYVWFRWKGDVDPTKSFELRNAVEQWQIVKVPTYADENGNPTPLVLDDGTNYQVFRIEARFGRPFSVASYPLDEQDLLFEIEESKYLTSELVYENDRTGSGVDKRIAIPGWEVVRADTTIDEAYFATTFGDTRVKDSEKYSRFTLGVHIARPKPSMIVKTIVPLAIVILMTFGVFFIDPTLVDARLGLSVTALVSAIALHFTTATELPEVGYLVLIDEVYILSYAIILLTTAGSIIAARYADAGAVARSHKLDRVLGVALAVLFFGGTSAIIAFR